MPIYEYICTACNEKFSLLQKMSATEKDSECPKCRSKNVRKLISSFCCSAGPETGFPSSGPSRGFGGGG